MPIIPNRPGISAWRINVFEIILKDYRKKISIREVALFCRKTAFLLDAGLSVRDAMPVVAEQTTDRALRLVVADLHSMVMQGESLSHALRVARVFPAFMCGYIAIGEKTARLPQVCEQLSDYYESRAKAESEFTAAMMYPAVVATMMLGVILMAITFVLPGYSRIFNASDVALPAFTAVLLNISDFFSANTFAVVGSFLLIIFGAIAFLRSRVGRFLSGRIMLRFSIWRQNFNLNFTQAMALLISSGLSIGEAVPLCADVLDKTACDDLDTLCKQVNSGVAFWEALGEIPYIDPLFIGLVRVGEETGKLPETLEKCNAYFEESYRSTIRRINKMVEPIVTLVLGIILAAVILAIILPTFQLAMAI
ncbi:MAG: type II secretion system F family protein [Defluviitaleaceae bacterium]|nr:type II secretion system F family protein [Defluviitaleaceae bacterium]